VSTRNSDRIAAKDGGVFVSVADKASQLKALKNSLSFCSKSKPVQVLVEKRKLLHKSKHPIGAVDLAKLSDAIGLGAAAARTLDRVLEIGDAASHALDQALHNAG
jgi:hypothetical protein